MSTCSSCGRSANICGCPPKTYQSPYKHVTQQPVYQTGQCGVQPVPMHPSVCPDPEDNCLEYNDNAQARPITYGMFEAVKPHTGERIPYAKVLVTYAGTTTKAPIYWHPDKESSHLLPNPVQTNEFGRTPLYFSGGPVDVSVFCEDGVTLVEQFTNYGGFQDSDWPNKGIPISECVSIDKPILKVYDAEKCNQPWAFIEFRHMMIRSNIDLGLPAGTYNDVKEYFECLGEEWPDGVLVYGECGECLELYKFKSSCTESCPSDPCVADIDCDGESECWTKCNHQKEDNWLPDGSFTLGLIVDQTQSNGADLTTGEVSYVIPGVVPECATHAKVLVFVNAKNSSQYTPPLDDQTEQNIQRVLFNFGGGLVNVTTVEAGLDVLSKNSDSSTLEIPLMNGNEIHYGLEFENVPSPTGADQDPQSVRIILQHIGYSRAVLI